MIGTDGYSWEWNRGKRRAAKVMEAGGWREKETMRTGGDGS